MKISGIRSRSSSLPADEPLAGAAENPNGKRPIVTLRVQTDGGAEGIGVAYFGGALTRTLAHAIDELGRAVRRRGPGAGRGDHQKLKNAAGGSAGPGGIYHLALSALDIALWDIRGQGGRTCRCGNCSAARASGCRPMPAARLMRGLSLDRVVKAAATLRTRAGAR